MKINPSIFREYDVRGIYNEDLNKEVAYKIGKAFGSYVKEKIITLKIYAFYERFYVGLMLLK